MATSFLRDNPGIEAALRFVPDRCIIGGFVIDVVEVEEYTLDAEVTQHPVEFGSNIADNVVNQPRQIKLDCTVSDTPLPDMVTTRQKSIGSEKPSEACYAHLQKLRDAREPTIVVGSMDIFFSVVIKGLSIPRRSKDGGALKFTATFEEVVIVRTTRAQVVSTRSGASSSRNGHKQPTPDSTVIPPVVFKAFPNSGTFYGPVDPKRAAAYRQTLINNRKAAGMSTNPSDLQDALDSFETPNSKFFDSYGNFQPAL